MPKITPDRDDRQGSMSGQGGPQQDPVGDGSDSNQQGGGAELEPGGGALGEGAQRHQNGSSRDSESRH